MFLMSYLLYAHLRRVLLYRACLMCVSAGSVRMGRKRVVVARCLEKAESGKSHKPVFERDDQPTDLAITGGLDEITGKSSDEGSRSNEVRQKLYCATSPKHLLFGVPEPALIPFLATSGSKATSRRRSRNIALECP